MGRPFVDEIEYLPSALSWAVSQPWESLKRALHCVGGDGALVVGSGGSFSAAVFCAELHEQQFGFVSRATTPLEFIEQVGRRHSVGCIFVSAEGKNNDILGSLDTAMERGYPAVALTLTRLNPLVERCAATGAAMVVSHEMPWRKDGYLATCSLLATMALFARAYDQSEQLKQDIARLPDWLQALRGALLDSSVLRELKVHGKVLILHSSAGRVGAIDLESKLAESGLAFGQISDYRQFAHGRHLQLVKPACCVIAFVSEQEELLEEASLALLPAFVHVLRIKLPNGHPSARHMGGVLASIAITEALAEIGGIDPGQPDVPEFGRAIHRLDVKSLLAPRPVMSPASDRKRGGATSQTSDDKTLSGGQAFLDRLSAARFKALVCDFDGTFCDTAKRFDGLAKELVQQLERILSAGLTLCFATGRGDSLIGTLQENIQQVYWSQVWLSCYSGSSTFRLDKEPFFPPKEPDFEHLAQWLADEGILARLGASPKSDAGQLGLRGAKPDGRSVAVSAIEQWFRSRGLASWRVFCSAHSVDVLSANAGKLRAVEEMARELGVDPTEEILRLGDAGDFGGNDFELLSVGYGLSVDAVSSSPTTCWNFLPLDRRGVVGTDYYLQALELGHGHARFSPAFIERSRFLL